MGWLLESTTFPVVRSDAIPQIATHTRHRRADAYLSTHISGIRILRFWLVKRYCRLKYSFQVLAKCCKKEIILSGCTNSDTDRVLTVDLIATITRNDTGICHRFIDGKGIMNFE